MYQIAHCCLHSSTSRHGGTWWRSCLRHCAASRKVAVSTGILHSQSFGPHCAIGIDTASNRNENQEYFLEGKGGLWVGLKTLPPSCADCLEIGSPNLLEPSGPVQGCIGIAF